MNNHVFNRSSTDSMTGVFKASKDQFRPPALTTQICSGPQKQVSLPERSHTLVAGLFWSLLPLSQAVQEQKHRSMPLVEKKNAVKGQSFIKSCIDFSFTVCSVILHLSYLVYYSQMTWTLIWSGQHWVKLHSDFFPQKPLLIASNASNVIIQSFKHASKQNLEP